MDLETSIPRSTLKMIEGIYNNPGISNIELEEETGLTYPTIAYALSNNELVKEVVERKKVDKSSDKDGRIVENYIKDCKKEEVEAIIRFEEVVQQALR